MRTGKSGGPSRLLRAAMARLPGRDDKATRRDPAAADAGSGRGHHPRLSVIVPMYQVEAYLEECLESVVEQDYENLEVVLVDDGSTDRTAEIARGFVERDPRFRLVQKQNAGLGAARNTGLEECTGELVAFLDSDDALPRGAYRKMVGTLMESGSDFVVGAHVRDEGGRSVQRTWVKQLHARRRLRVTVDDVPEVLGNVFAWTKMFRREFLERIDLRFPEGVRYEDQVPMTRAYLEAEAFDIIPAPVYRWRKRDDGSSITQQKRQAADMHDRLAAKREIAAMLEEKASPKVRDSWYVKVFRIDVMPYLRAGLQADDEYWRVLAEDVTALYDAAPASIWELVELRFRLAAFLAATGQREVLARLLDYQDLQGSNFAVRQDGRDLYAVFDLLADGHGSVPPDLLRLRPIDVPVRAHLAELDWRTEGRLGVRGVAFMRHVEPGVYDVRTQLSLRRPEGGGEPVLASVRQDPDPVANQLAVRPEEDHTGSMFRATFDLRELVRATGDDRRTTWDADATLEALGITTTERFLDVVERGSALATRAQVVDGALVTGGWHPVKGLSLTVLRRYAALRSASFGDGAFDLVLLVSPGREVSGLTCKGRPVPAEVRNGSQEEVHVKVSAADLAGSEGGLRLERGEGNTLEIAVLCELDWLAGHPDTCPVALTTSPACTLRVSENQPVLVVDAVRLDGDTVLAEGRAHAVAGFTARLLGRRAGSLQGQGKVVDGHFAVSLPARRRFWDGASTPLPPGAYTLEVDAGGADVRVRAALALQDLPSTPRVRGWTVEVGERRAFAVRRSRDLDPGVDSAYGQRRLQSTVYAEARSAPRADMVVFEYFGGTGTGDTPGAVCDLLRARDSGLDLVWSLVDDSVPVPAGTRAVTRRSPEWYAAVGSAKYLFSNNNFPDCFEKAPGQVHVQTWHGTPLKRIGHDIADRRFFDESYFKLMDREAAGWDYLVSPSPFCTEVLPRALRTPAKVLEVGYPRNDLLLSPDAATVRAETRAGLGLGDEQRVVLYAPTWRENQKSAGAYRKVLHLDAPSMVSAREDVTVLVRGHANTAGRRAVDDDERVLDVTSYPDINRLFLAADVLVTDYSSVMFDFALTDKPMLFLVPDLEEYRDELRGFYLDFEEIAPGPLVGSTEEVLAHLDDDQALFAPARARVRDRFAPHDDGHAAERLVQAVLGQA